MAIIIPSGGSFTSPVEITFSCSEGTRVLYSTDGSEPDIVWDNNPVLLTGGTNLVRVICQNNDCTINAQENCTFIVGSLAEDPIIYDGYGYGYS